MKKIYFLIPLLITISCSSNNKVYWCGDHPCINNKEKESYFKKTMTVEIKDLKDEDLKKISEIEKITQQARINEKKRIISEKEIAKQLKLEEKRKIKEEKEIAKQLKLEEKRKIKKEKKPKKDYSENLNKKIASKKVSKTIEGSSLIGNLSTKAL